MIEFVDDILCWTVLPLATGLSSYQFGVFQTALSVLPYLPKECSHRSRSLRISRHEGVIEFEVGWIGRISACIQRP